jgi:predicted signal transduction protein with EAL and GGDEF domain
MKTDKSKPKQRPHYVNNRDFSEAVVEHVRETNIAIENGTTEPIIPEYIGECFLKIAEGLSHKPNFVRYTYRDEMVMDAVENCIKAINNYNIEAATRTGKPNAFAYFTQISYFAFLRRIAKEKKQQDIKLKYIEQSGIDAFADVGGDYSGDSIVERIKNRIDAIKVNDQSLKDWAKENGLSTRKKRKIK